jgi:hypothetical protein
VLKTNRILLLVIAGMLCFEFGCQDYNLQNEEAQIEVVPDELSYGYVTMGTVATREFEILNTGDATATIERFEFLAPVDYLVLDRDLNSSFNLSESASVKVVVSFSPMEEIEAEDNIVYVYHNVSADPEEVLLHMSAGQEPDINADPNPVSMGAVNSNETRNQVVVLSNQGSGWLSLDQIAYYGDPEFTVDVGNAVGVELGNGQVTDINVIFNANGGSGSFSGEIEVLSNDPDENPYIIPVSAASGGPVAYCHAAPAEVTPIHESSTFYAHDENGVQSEDPNYSWNELSFWWTLVSKPAGSTATLPNQDMSERILIPDMAGTYTGQLIVCNPLEECSDPCQASFEGIPTQDLWVEMFWAHAGDDMDLHLIAPGGQYWSTSSDCHWRNMNPDWGAPGSSVDDPVLDLDDIPGTGPENINLGNPGPGTYMVTVHDHTSNSYAQVNDVTVNVYSGGGLACTTTIPISGEDSVNNVFEVEYPSGTCTPL